jgi:hypothetical protein
LGTPYWLPHGRSLCFKVEHCNVPMPYQLFWKVRNVGAEAERRQMADLEKLLSNSSISESAAMKAILEAEKLNSLIPKIPDTIGEHYRYMLEEERAKREWLMLGAIPKSASEVSYRVSN